jgi:hypothetical protein
VETLADRIARDGPLNELDAVGWIIRLAKKLETLHARAVAHGGISPLAIKAAGVPRTSLGMIAGIGASPGRIAFYSPERVLQGGPSPADDTWATAATLFALLTGQSPFAAPDDDMTKAKVLASQASPLSMFDVGDDDLQHILDAAFVRDASQRASTITALRQALEAWHPDPLVRDLPPLADDQPDEDEEEERTVMRPAVSMSALRSHAAKRAQPQPPAPPPPRAQLATTPDTEGTTEALASSTRAEAAKKHNLLEDEDEENQKTSMMTSPMRPFTFPSAAQKGMSPAAPKATPAGTALMPQRPAGAPAARVAHPSRPGVQAFNAAAAPPAVPAEKKQIPDMRGAVMISREAVIDDGDDEEQTVMRAAPLELLRKAGKDDATEADRATPVNPIPAEVAAAGHLDDDDAMPTLAMSAEEASKLKLPQIPPTDARPPQPTMVLPNQGDDPATDPLGRASAPQIETRMSEHSISRPSYADPRQSQSSIAIEVSRSFSVEHSVSTPQPPPGFGPPPQPAPSFGAPPQPGPMMQAAPQVVAPPEPSKGKGFLIGVLLALLLIAAAGGVYFFLHPRLPF